MQRPEAKNPPARHLLSSETGNSKIGVKNPRRNGPFPVGNGFRGSGRLRGGVRSHVRTGLSPDKCPFAGYFCELLPVVGKCAEIGCVNSMAYKRIP